MKKKSQERKRMKDANKHTLRKTLLYLTSTLHIVRMMNCVHTHIHLHIISKDKVKSPHKLKTSIKKRTLKR